MEKINDLQELLKHELKDLYSAEAQLIEAIPDMVKKASSPELKKAFNGHLKETHIQKKRLDKVQDLLNMEKSKESKGFFANLFTSDEGEEHCKAMEGLIKEANSLMDEDMSPDVMDAALIAAAQKIEHYEISSYGTARAFALQLGFKKVYDTLTATLAEEYGADDSLTVLAVGKVNIMAEGGSKQKPSSKKIVPKNARVTISSGKTATQKTLVKKTAKPIPAKKPVAKKSGRKATA